MNDASGWLSLIIDVVLVAILAAALIYGSVMWRRWKQTPAQAAEREQRTRELFRENIENRSK